MATFYGPRPMQAAQRHHGRNWPHNINSPGVHTFQRDRQIYEEQDYYRTDLYGRPLPPR